MSAPLFGITGWKNSGKTALTERLVAELTRRGLTVATVKHAHHDFDIDQPGTDSHRHRLAGAREVAVVSARRWALMHESGPDEPAPTLDEIVARLSPCDLVLVEGYKREGHAKIECRRAEAASVEPLAPRDPAIMAIATDEAGHVARKAGDEGGLPCFHLDDIVSIADFIVGHLKLGGSHARRVS